MARSVEWKVLFSQAVRNEEGTVYTGRAPVVGPNSSTNNGGSAGSIYMGTQDLYLGGQTESVPGLEAAGLVEWYKAAPVRIPAGSGDDVNYSYEKFVALRFVDPGGAGEPTVITNMHVWKNSGTLQDGVAVFACLADREVATTDASELPVMPESTVAIDSEDDPIAVEADFDTVITAMKAELPTHTLTDSSATDGWVVFAAPLFDTSDPSECYDKTTALQLSNPNMSTETDWMIGSENLGLGYTNELLVFMMAVMAGCSSPGDIQAVAPVTIMVEYNES